jgi:hypoxanthine phosphoribosyltransferase
MNFIPDIIVPVIRGGLIPATILSHYFNCPQVAPIQWQTRDLSFKDDEFELPEDKFILIVEDIVDSGVTLRSLSKIIDKRDDVVFVSLLRNTKTNVETNFKVLSSLHYDLVKSWHVFPWENK